jgi:hypothetical protein
VTRHSISQQSKRMKRIEILSMGWTLACSLLMRISVRKEMRDLRIEFVIILTIMALVTISLIICPRMFP